MSTKEKEQVLRAIRDLGRRVTVADVAERTGLPLNIVTTQLNSIAADTGGDLQVATTGDIAYRFPLGFQNAYLATGAKRVVMQVARALFNAGYYLLRISFGIMLILSLLAIAVLIFIAMQAMSRGSDDRDGGAQFEFDFFDYLILRDLLWWGAWSSYPDATAHDRPSYRVRRKSNFFLNCFSFLFGDGNPNAHLEERKWRLIAQAIKANNGVATCEMLAPYTGANPKDENAVLPVLVRFDGRPEVTDTGNIIYVFPSLQVRAAENNGGEGASVPAYLHEFPWKFSNAGSGDLMPVMILAAVNFLGSWWLLIQLHTPLGLVLWPFAPLIVLLVLYGTAFVTIPLVRWLALKLLNKGIERRNALRMSHSRLLENPDRQLQTKLDEAKACRIEEKMLRQDQIVYSTEKDVLEQEFPS